jgi:amidase
MGEETVSSGRSPSSNNALVAYTPSRGVISIRGNWPLFPIKDVVVPMTRTMGDMFEVLNSVVADDPITRGDLWRDQKAVPLPAASAVRPADYHDLAKADALRGKRIGVPTMYIGKDNSGKPIPIRPSVLALWEKTAAALRAQGAEVVEVDFPIQHNYDVDRPEAQSFVDRGLIAADWFPRFKDGARIGTDMEFGKLNPFSWEQFVHDNADPKLSSWKDVDPSQVFPYYPGEVDYRRFGPTRDTYARARETILAGVTPFDQIPGYDAALRGLEQIRKVDFEQWLDANRLDFIAFPANTDVGLAKADVDDEAYNHATSNGVARSNTNAMLRHMGIPSVSVSMGLMEDTGMPVNVTFAGKAYSDNDLLAYGYAYEAATHNRRPPARILPLADERIDYDPTTSIAPARRKETLPPKVSVASAARLSGAGAAQSVTISGSASDASGLAIVRIYVNGHKVSEGTSGKWSASISAAQLRQWMNAGDKTFIVTALARDRLGNAAADMKAIALP